MNASPEITKLRLAREDGEFSRAQVARKLGLTQQMLQRIEEGEKIDYDARFPEEYAGALESLDAERRRRMLAAIGKPHTT